MLWCFPLRFVTVVMTIVQTIPSWQAKPAFSQAVLHIACLLTSCPRSSTFHPMFLTKQVKHTHKLRKKRYQKIALTYSKGTPSVPGPCSPRIRLLPSQLPTSLPFYSSRFPYRPQNTAIEKTPDKGKIAFSEVPAHHPVVL